MAPEPTRAGYAADGVTCYLGDNAAVLPTLATASWDAIVTDPPAGIAFMGKAWDSALGGRQAWIAWLASVLTEVRRVVKPGGHALVWALPRTSHWTATALEDAGWEIRDVVTHLTGQGFPKSLDVGKALDKAAGAERTVTGLTSRPDGTTRQADNWATGMGYHGWDATARVGTAPATDLARQWDGWGTALKPAAEHWILARAPLSEKTVAANVSRWGTGALNIGATRIGYDGPPPAYTTPSKSGLGRHGIYAESTREQGANSPTRYAAAGRWPANCVLSHTLFCTPVGTRQVRGHGAFGLINDDGWQPKAEGQTVGYAAPDGTETVEAWDCAPDCPVALLDQQSGERGRTGAMRSHAKSSIGGYGIYGGGGEVSTAGHSDSGGASRFFYVSKASTAERSAGLPDGERNSHPTVKPVALCRWLIRLITPPGGTVGDPFMGSGSIGVAARAEGVGYVGMEQDPASYRTALQRLGAPEGAWPL